jgi:hypothetical protein
LSPHLARADGNGAFQRDGTRLPPDRRPRMRCTRIEFQGRKGMRRGRCPGASVCRQRERV